MNHHEEAEQHLRELLKNKQEQVDSLEFNLMLREMNIRSLIKELEILGKTVDNNLCSTSSCMH